ncbi:MAG: CHAT domain-containing protein [Acidobacteriia bacterium]|nr:CHAT domain-containing protein [Terriglobia bacterium]
MRASTQAQAVEALLARNPPAVTEAFLTVERDRSFDFGETNPTSRTTPESFAHIALPNIQHGISPDEAVLSLYLGTQSSCLWAVTQEGFEFHRLAAPTQLAALAHEFRNAVESNSPHRDVLGQRLYRELFGELSAGVRRKPQWLVIADDTLFDVPFPTLVAGNQKGNPVYLVEEHSTQRISSALTLVQPVHRAARGAFLGIGDGIYNTADPRWTSRHGRISSELRDSTFQLTRLPASGTELASSAREWRGNTNVLLTGLGASSASFQASLKMRPRVIHIAAHVIQPDGNAGQALIYLGLSENGRPQTLTQNEIAKLNVSGSTVVMSGCSSAGLQSVEGAAILGLTRAWLLAGARAVVGSRWATPDDTGELFQVFYRDLRDRCDRGADGRVIGASLQQAQQAMLRSSTWRSNPSYWGALYAVGKE